MSIASSFIVERVKHAKHSALIFFEAVPMNRASTSASLPGFAFNSAYNANFAIFKFL